MTTAVVARRVMGEAELHILAGNSRRSSEDELNTSVDAFMYLRF